MNFLLISDQTCGLCGNFNGNQNDDFTTPSHDVGVSAIAFGDSYKVDTACEDTKEKKHPCKVKPWREQWSHKQVYVEYGTTSRKLIKSYFASI